MGKLSGSLVIESENIFPIIKKWLYTEQDVFFRELITNGADAIRKMNKLINAGEYDSDPIAGHIEVIVNADEHSIKFIDDGLGMTWDEVERYINQIAFSGASDFMEQYRDLPEGEQIIGHFGLGFYSAFMMAERVTIDTQSWRKDELPVHWECRGDMNFNMSDGAARTRGSEMTLFVADDCPYLKAQAAADIIKKYFAFFPIDIDLTFLGPDEAGREPFGTQRINDTSPLWTRSPELCNHDEYIKFYHKVFKDWNDPVDWVHIHNNEKGINGIFFFRNMESEDTGPDGTVKLYNDRVFVADNVKEVVPSYMLLENGVLDCTNMPLAVSRSSLQASPEAQEISRFIAEEIVKHLYGLFVSDRTKYESIWLSLSAFMKYACIKDNFFSSYLNKFIVFRTINGKYVTLKEHLEAIKSTHENQVFYVSDDIQQAYYISMFRRVNIDALMMTHVIDQPYIRKLEMYTKDLHFVQVDSDLSDVFRTVLDEEGEKQRAEAEATLSAIMAGELAPDITVRAEKLVIPEVSAIITLNEQQRRMRDTVALYGAVGIALDAVSDVKRTFLLNISNPLVKYVLDHPDSDRSKLVLQQLYSLSLLGQENLKADALAHFLDRSNQVLELLCQ